MAKIWEPQPIEVYKDWIKSILDVASDDLNDWENTFVASLDERLTKGKNLTEAQADKLESIYAEKT